MAKADVLAAGLPPVPKKRRQLEAALDLHIALWLASDDLTPSERRRIQEEKDRRKLAVDNLVVGVVVGHEGVTPEQLTTIRGIVHGVGVTEVHAGQSLKLGLEEGFVLHRDRDLVERHRAIVRASDVLVAAPKEAREPVNVTPAGVWAMVKYAKHRKVPVRVVMQDGVEREV